LDAPNRCGSENVRVLLADKARLMLLGWLQVLYIVMFIILFYFSP